MTRLRTGTSPESLPDARCTGIDLSHIWQDELTTIEKQKIYEKAICLDSGEQDNILEMEPVQEATEVAQPVSISYKDLVDLNKLDSLFPELCKAFGDGPECLGILLVHDLPEDYLVLRRVALTQASRVSQLSKDELARLTSKESNYLSGWSHGQEMANGVPDTNKGSFYFNPTYDYTNRDHESTKSAFPEYESPNLWPAIPDFQESILDLATFIVSIGSHVARVCDSYVRSIYPDYSANHLENMVKNSRTCKARLLHYFPSSGDNRDGEEAWCGEHLDHGCLTGLTSAMFLREDEIQRVDTLEELDKSPDPRAGLYIKSRSGKVKKVLIPRSSLAFQTGEALQLTTSDTLRAVPHFVRGSAVPHIARNTMAVFMQPNLDDVLGDSGVLFKDFARGIVQKNYGTQNEQ